MQLFFTFSLEDFKLRYCNNVFIKSKYKNI